MPAKLIRYRFNEKAIEALLSSQWWKYNFTDLPKVNYTNIEGFIEALDELKYKNKINEFTPPASSIFEDLKNIVDNEV